MCSTASVYVAVPDHPGELARLVADAGEIGVNIEDVHIDDALAARSARSSWSSRSNAGQLTDALGERALTVHLEVGSGAAEDGGRRRGGRDAAPALFRPAGAVSTVSSRIVVAIDGPQGRGTST